MSTARATLKDVAKEANVSTATVSMVINNKPVPITKETKERVYAAARKLNYQPNMLARSLATSTSNTIGMLIPDSSNPYNANLSHLVRSLFLKKGITVMTGNTDYDPEVAKKYLQVFAERHVDGLIISQLDFKVADETEECRKMIAQMRVPVISYGRDESNDPHISTVAVDQKEIGYLATKHLLSLGHRRIGCVAGDMNLDVCRTRYEGYKQALHEFDLQEDPALLHSGSFSVETGAEGLPTLLGEGVTGVFAFSDMIAYGVYKACKNFNISIPADLSVVGVDDIFFSDIIDPPLTTVAQPIDEIAAALVNTMCTSLEKNDTYSTHTLHSKLKVRGSTKKV